MEDLLHRRFGSLVVESVLKVGNRTIWQCRCDCSHNTFATTEQLLRKEKASCGSCNRDDAIAERIENYEYKYVASREAFNAIRETFGTTEEELRDSNRAMPVVIHRHLYVYLLHEWGMTIHDIAYITRIRNRATLFNSVRSGEYFASHEYMTQYETLWNTFQTNMSSSASCATKTATSSSKAVTSTRKTENN